MSRSNESIKTPEIKDGGVVEIFACGGQCRGKNRLPDIMSLSSNDKNTRLEQAKAC